MLGNFLSRYLSHLLNRWVCLEEVVHSRDGEGEPVFVAHNMMAKVILFHSFPKLAAERTDVADRTHWNLNESAGIDERLGVLLSADLDVSAIVVDSNGGIPWCLGVETAGDADGGHA